MICPCFLMTEHTSIELLKLQAPALLLNFKHLLPIYEVRDLGSISLNSI